MSTMKNIGEGSTISCKYEWKICNFFSYSGKDSMYRSPNFHLSNSAWYIQINPNGKTAFNSTEYVSLFLYRDTYSDTTDPSPVTVTFSIGIKTVNNVIVSELKATHTFKVNDDWGWHEFIEKSLLMRTKSEMVPSDILTIICCIETNNAAVPILHARHSKLVEDFKNLFISQENSDVTLNVKEKTCMAHRTVLGARSPVLAAMFKNDTQEKKTGIVNIPDCDPEAFNVFLLYLYSGIIDFENCNNVCELYRISDKYDVPELKIMCTDFMSKNISVDTFCDIVIIGEQFDEDKLLTEAQDFFNENFEEIVSSKSWESFLGKYFRIANSLLKAMAPNVKIK